MVLIQNVISLYIFYHLLIILLQFLNEKETIIEKECECNKGIYGNIFLLAVGLNLSYHFLVSIKGVLFILLFPWNFLNLLKKYKRNSRLTMKMDYIIEYHKVLIQNNPNQQHDESIDYDKLLIDEDMDISEEMASIIDGLHGSCIQNAVNVPIDSLIKLMEMERQRSEKPKVICYLCEYDIVEDQNSLCYYKCCPEN